MVTSCTSSRRSDALSSFSVLPKAAGGRYGDWASSSGTGLRGTSSWVVMLAAVCCRASLQPWVVRRNTSSHTSCRQEVTKKNGVE